MEVKFLYNPDTLYLAIKGETPDVIRDMSYLSKEERKAIIYLLETTAALKQFLEGRG